MSSNQSATFPSISGGLPTSVDLVPSILFVVLYCATLPVGTWRAWTYRKPRSLLSRACRLLIFACVRVVTFAIRATEAHAAAGGQLEPNFGMFIAEQILLSIGFIVLVSQLVDLIKSHLERTDVSLDDRPVDPGTNGSKFSLRNLSRLMNLMLIVAMILGIYAGSQYSKAISNPTSAGSIKTIRIVSMIITLVVIVLAIFVSLLLLVNYPHLPRRASAYILACSSILVIVPSYRLSSLAVAQTSYDSLTSTTTKVEFWVLQPTMEWIVLMLFLAVDVRLWFGCGGAAARIAMGKGGDPAGVVDPVRSEDASEMQKSDGGSQA